MKSVTMTCDRCGQPATEWARIYRHDLVNSMHADAHDLVELDLCPTCAQELADWMVNEKGEDDGNQR